MPDTPTDPQPDPLEELRKVKDENQRILEEMKAEREKMQRIAGSAVLAGRSTVGNEEPNLTPEQLKQKKAQEEADKIVKAFK